MKSVIHFHFSGTPKDKYVIGAIPVNQSRIQRKFTRVDIVETTSAVLGDTLCEFATKANVHERIGT